MARNMVFAAMLLIAPVCSAGAATIVLLPEPGSMSPPTVIVDPRASDKDPVLVCTSFAQLSTGGCVLRNRAPGLRRGS